MNGSQELQTVNAETGCTVYCHSKCLTRFLRLPFELPSNPKASLHLSHSHPIHNIFATPTSYQEKTCFLCTKLWFSNQKSSLLHKSDLDLESQNKSPHESEDFRKRAGPTNGLKELGGIGKETNHPDRHTKKKQKQKKKKKRTIPNRQNLHNRRSRCSPEEEISFLNRTTTPQLRNKTRIPTDNSLMLPHSIKQTKVPPVNIKHRIQSRGG